MNYGDKSFIWSSGRNLASITDGDNTYSYTYDESGIRTSKTVNGVTTYFNTKDGVVLSQTDGTNTMYFQYDTNGAPLGFIWNGTQYLYMTNQMGDIISIADAQGNELVRYEYDEWGKIGSIITTNNTSAENILANINPLRYRGYYYDNETGYYYLQSRYYDANICRFINADIYDYAKNNNNIINGCNIFIYCYNNAVSFSDFDGKTVKFDEFYDIMIYDYKLDSGHYSYVTTPKYTSKYNKNKSLVSEEVIEKETKSYACVVTALFGIIRQENMLLKNSIKKTYNELWKDTKTQETSESKKNKKNATSNGITYGSTSAYNTSSGIKSYCKSYNKTQSKKYNQKKVTIKTKRNPKFEFFKDAIDDNKSVYMSMGVNVKGVGREGHGVNVVGYFIVKNKATGKKINYLIVADGWYDYKVAYVNYKSENFTDTYGANFKFERK